MRTEFTNYFSKGTTSILNSLEVGGKAGMCMNGQDGTQNMKISEDGQLLESNSRTVLSKEFTQDVRLMNHVTVGVCWQNGRLDDI